MGKNTSASKIFLIIISLEEYFYNHLALKFYIYQVRVAISVRI